MTKKGSEGAFNGVRVFSATMVAKRQTLGEEVTRWLEESQARPGFEIVDIVVRQSSDATFHCFSLVLFFREDVEVPKETKRRG